MMTAADGNFDDFQSEFAEMTITFRRAISKLQYELSMQVSDTTPLYTYKLTIPAQLDLLAQGEWLASQAEMGDLGEITALEFDYLDSFYQLAKAIVGPSFE